MSTISHDVSRIRARFNPMKEAGLSKMQKVRKRELGHAQKEIHAKVIHYRELANDKSGYVATGLRIAIQVLAEMKKAINDERA